jgi:hypothetical protein
MGSSRMVSKEKKTQRRPSMEKADSLSGKKRFCLRKDKDVSQWQWYQLQR